jgi:hypothetical protein
MPRKFNSLKANTKSKKITIVGRALTIQTAIKKRSNNNIEKKNNNWITP